MRTSYPFAATLLCLMPAALMLCAVRILIGPEDAVFACFTRIRAAYPHCTAIMQVLTQGMLVLFYPVYAFFLIRGLRGRRREDVLFVLCYVAAQVLVTALFGRVVKIAVGRPRPMTGGPLAPFSFGWGYQSFPSGHTAEAVGSSLPLVWRYGLGTPFLLPLGLGLVVALVGFSRLYLGMHHPSDIWGGLVFGSLSGYVSWMLFGALHTRWNRFCSGWMEASRP